jgi:hypothetical protein
MRRKPFRPKPCRPQVDAPAGIALPTFLSAVVSGGAVLALAVSGSLVIAGTAVPFASNLPILRHPDAIAAPARPPVPVPAPAPRRALPTMATELPVTFRASPAGRVAPQAGGDDARAAVHTVVHRLHSTETRTGTDPRQGSGGSGSGGTGSGGTGSGGTGSGGTGSGGTGSGSTPGGTDGGGCHHGTGHGSGGDGRHPGLHDTSHRHGPGEGADHHRSAGHHGWGHPSGNHNTEHNGDVDVTPAADTPSAGARDATVSDATVSDAPGSGATGSGATGTGEQVGRVQQVGQVQQDGAGAVQG